MGLPVQGGLGGPEWACRGSTGGGLRPEPPGGAVPGYSPTSAYHSLIEAITCCRCRRVSPELTVLGVGWGGVQNVENVFDLGFMKEAVALMVLVTFHHCRD